MEIEIIVPIIVLIGCILLIVIKNSSDENFKSEKRESDIILPNPIATYISNIKNKKEIIINQKDKNNNFPIQKPKIVPPTISNIEPKKDEAYKDVNFVRDEGVEIAMKEKIKLNDKDYKKVVDRNLTFEYPENSNNLLTSLDINNISQKTYDTSYLSNLYDDMTSKVINNISQEQINSITGKAIEEKNINGYYNPLLSLIDGNLKKDNNNDTEYKYSGYNEMPMLCIFTK